MDTREAELVCHPAGNFVVQRLLDSVIGDMKGVFCYLDDLLIFSKTQEEHLQILDELFSKLSKAGLSISLKKCQFGISELEYSTQDCLNVTV